MSAAVTEPPKIEAAKAKPNYLGDVATALGDAEMKVPELLQLVGEKALNIAWTGGYVEFGHRDFSVTGNPDNPQTHALSQLHVESAESWTGPKTQQHCPLKLILSRGINIPRVGAYKFNRAAEPDYRPVADVSPLAEIDRATAESLVFLKCRLTDKGHQLLLDAE